MGKRDAPRGPAGSPGSPGFTDSLNRCIERYRQEPENVAVQDCLRQARREIAESCLASPPERLQMLFAGGMADAFRKTYECGVRLETPTPDETVLGEELVRYLEGNPFDPGVAGRLLAAMLYLRADQLRLDLGRENVPLWLFPLFLRYLFDQPKFFRDQDEIGGYLRHVSGAIEFLSGIITGATHRFARNTGVVQEAVRVALTSIPLHPVYFCDGDLRALYTARAALLEQALRRAGFQTGHRPARRNADGARIRVGILNTHFHPQTETYACLPVFEHLDRARFEVRLYYLEKSEHPVARYCLERADSSFHLDGDLARNVRTLREHDLDILFIGSNLTAWSSPVTLIALHRTARAQVASVCSPVTSGMDSIDYYIAGELALGRGDASRQYREELLTMEGSGFCFSYVTGPEPAQCRFTRARLGISDNAVVYASGANFFKIVPDLRSAWADIIAAVPDSVLLLYPFNPYWAGSYAAGRQLIDTLRAGFRARGVADDRLVIQQPLPQRADIKELLGTADVYLDAFPYSGATSLIDPLETGLPAVTMEGPYLRFRQGSALLRELGVAELVTSTRPEYIALACRLGRDAEFRRQLQGRIRERMSQQPAVLDSRAYSAKIGTLFERIIPGRGDRG